MASIDLGAKIARATRAAMGNLTVDNLLQYFSDRRVLTPVPELTHLNPAG